MVVAPYRFCVLAPAGEMSAARRVREKLAFLHQSNVGGEYLSLLGSMQQLRGQIYFADGAIPATALDDCGRFCLPDDKQCWHLLLLDENEKVIGCVRYRLYSGSVAFNDLRVRHSAAAQHPALGDKVRRAIEQELLVARQQGLSFVEIGGWALAPRWRHTQAALQLLAASYALGEIWGGCVGIATVTLRHRSAVMLRRLGGRSLDVDGEELPPYKDSVYDCHMELLRFGRTPNSRFAPVVEEVVAQLLASKVVFAQPAAFPAVA